jgi:HPt (histidine-containing phosphotransfer) domain-containing protein
MDASVRWKFLPTFIRVAKGRLERAGDHLAGEAPATYELHALAGEAALLGLAKIAAAAQRGELTSKRWHDTKNEDERAACEAALRELRNAVDFLAFECPPGA